jgi:hypothetical protein
MGTARPNDWPRHLSKGEKQKMQVGNRVWARWTGVRYYPGKITKQGERGFYVVFDDGDKDWFPPSDILRVSGQILIGVSGQTLIKRLTQENKDIKEAYEKLKREKDEEIAAIKREKDEKIDRLEKARVTVQRELEQYKAPTGPPSAHGVVADDHHIPRDPKAVASLKQPIE